MREVAVGTETRMGIVCDVFAVWKDSLALPMIYTWVETNDSNVEKWKRL